MMQEKNLNINFKARYFKLGELTERTKEIWFVLHGYGQLAQYFLSKFKKLAEHDIVVIAPEGLSRFYLQDVATRSQTGNNRVGASWMTRENRLMDIENYITYLNSIYTDEVRREIPIKLLGFSQGAATASRWAMQGSVNFNTLILWAGIFPNDIDFEKGKEFFKTKDVKIVFGNGDQFLTPERIDEIKVLLNKLNLPYNPIVFDGGHEIHETTLLKLITN
jgi:predicted esterase